MTMRSVLLFVLLVCLAGTAGASGTRWFPGGTTFLPPLANPEEARVSAQQDVGSSRLRVGLGNVLDLVRITGAGGTEFSLGFDAYAYALSNTISGARLKIDLVDGSFGVHATWTDSTALSWRLRALHISAHVADGTFDRQAGVWLPGRTPIPFSRNFFELTAAYAVTEPLVVRPYGMISAAWFNNPGEIRTMAFGIGSDVIFPLAPSPYASVHFALLGVPDYAGTVTAEAGVRFGDWRGHGLRLYLAFASGLEPYGQIYTTRVTSWSIGVAFDFWELNGAAGATMSAASPR
jgi:hypothetical protein